MRLRVASALLLMALAACGPGRRETAERAMAAAPVSRIAATVETVVPDNPTVDADDPVLWADPSDPARALLIGTDKSIGLYVHDLSGRVLQFFPAGPLNNVDMRPFPLAGRPTWLVAAAERDRFGIALWLLDPATRSLSDFGYLPTPRAFGEPYGFCMGQWDGATYLIANNKEGAVLAFRVNATPAGPRMDLAHQWKLGSQTEGCVVDDRTGDLFVGEEDVGIWRMRLAQPAQAPTAIAAVDGQRLVADVEGLTLMHDGEATYLLASSQGDSAYAVWRLAGGTPQWVGRFRIGGGQIDPVTQTDGLDAFSGPIGPFPQGAIAVHDHCDGPTSSDPPASVCDGESKQQNYKIIDWRDIRRALDIR